MTQQEKEVLVSVVFDTITNVTSLMARETSHFAAVQMMMRTCEAIVNTCVMAGYRQRDAEIIMQNLNNHG